MALVGVEEAVHNLFLPSPLGGRQSGPSLRRAARAASWRLWRASAYFADRGVALGAEVVLASVLREQEVAGSNPVAPTHSTFGVVSACACGAVWLTAEVCELVCKFLDNGDSSTTARIVSLSGCW